MPPVAGGHKERENKVASGKKFECEERREERNGRSDLDGRTDGPTTDGRFSSDFRKENEVLGGKRALPASIQITATTSKMVR